MAFTTDDLARIERAMATGELEVELDGKRIKYRSITELTTARNNIRAELIASGGLASSGTARSYASFSKG